MNIKNYTLASLFIAAVVYAPEKSPESITPRLLTILRSAPEHIWGKNTSGLNESYNGIKKEALAQSPTNATYHVYWAPRKVHAMPIEKAHFYIHRYVKDFTDQNPALLTTNIWISGDENIKRFEKCYGITRQHDDNDMNDNFKARFIDKHTTCYYWDCTSGERRYTFLTYMAIATLVAQLDI